MKQIRQKKRYIATFILLLAFLGNCKGYYQPPNPVSFSQHPKDTVTYENGPLELICQIPLQQSPVDPVILWEVDQQRVSGVFTDSSVEVRDQDVDEEEMTITSVLRIPQAQLRHAGVYRCMARDGEDSSECQDSTFPCVSTVTVSLDAKLEVLGNSSDGYQGVNVTLCSSVILPCGSREVDPASHYHLSWRRDGQEMGGEEEGVVLSLDGDLLLHRSEACNLSASFECLATFPNGQTVILSQYQVQHIEEPTPLLVNLHLSSPVVAAGSSTDLICTVQGFCPEEIVWQRNGLAIGVSGGRTLLSNGTIVRIDSVTVEDAGTYCCEAGTEEWRMEVCRELRVADHPLISSPQNGTTLYLSRSRSGNISIQCTAQEEPGQTLTWFHNGIALNESLYSSIDNSLEMSSSNPSELYGIYQCFVTNPAGAAVSTTRVLPQGLTNPPQNVSIKELPRPHPDDMFYRYLRVSWDPPDFTAELSDICYSVEYFDPELNRLTSIVTCSRSTEILFYTPHSFATVCVTVVNPTSHDAISSDEWIFKIIDDTCFDIKEVRFPPRLVSECDGHIFRIHWSNNPLNERFRRQDSRPSTYWIWSSCTYNNSSPIEMEDPFQSEGNGTEGDFAAGTVCVFMGAALPRPQTPSSPQCYDLEEVARSETQCVITALVQLVTEEYNVSEGSGTVTVCASAEGFGFSVILFTTDGTAEAGSDYMASVAELLFTAEEHFMRVNDNQLQQCASISLIDDDFVESSLKSFKVGLMTDHPHVIVGGTNATVNILDDDVITVGFEAGSYTAVEDEGSVTVCLLLSGEADTSVSLNISTSDVSATEGTDYFSVQEMVTFEPGSTNATWCMNISVTDDSAVETDETFAIVLTTTSRYIELLNNWTKVIIVDDDAVEAIIVLQEDSVTENSGSVDVCVRLEGEFHRPISVNLTTSSSGNAVVSPSIPRSITFIPFGSTNECIPFEIIDDSVVEDNEEVSIELSSTDTAVDITTSSVSLTVRDDDSVEALIVLQEDSVTENSGSVYVCVILDGEFHRPISVNLTTSSSGNAVSPSIPRNITFISFGSECIPFDIIDDSVVEDNEEVSIDLSSADTAVDITTSSVSLTVRDDDFVTLRFEHHQYNVTEEEDNVTVCVLLEGELNRSAAVNISTWNVNVAGDAGSHISRNTITFRPVTNSVTYYNECTTLSLLSDGSRNFLLVLTSQDHAVEISNNESLIVIQEGSPSLQTASDAVLVATTVIPLLVAIIAVVTVLFIVVLRYYIHKSSTGTFDPSKDLDPEYLRNGVTDYDLVDPIDVHSISPSELTDYFDLYPLEKEEAMTDPVRGTDAESEVLEPERTDPPPSVEPEREGDIRDSHFPPTYPIEILRKTSGNSSSSTTSHHYIPNDWLWERPGENVSSDPEEQNQCPTELDGTNFTPQRAIVATSGTDAQLTFSSVETDSSDDGTYMNKLQPVT